MSTEVLVAILSLMGTFIGSVVGILTAQKLTAYRIEQLEKSVEKLSGVFERTALAEKDIKGLCERTERLEKVVLEI